MVGAGAALLSIAGNRLAHLFVDSMSGAWPALPSFLLLIGAVGFLLVSGADLRLAFDVVVNHDVRGRRRWEAAESELARARRFYRGRAHDVTGILSAVDGSLFVLGRDTGSLQDRQRDQLITAMREQVQHLRSLLSGEGDAARPYDVGELIRGIVAVHTSAGRAVDVRVEPSLIVHGHPDRVASIVNNLLANAAAHAPGSRVALGVTREHTRDGDLVAITVSDDGPGLAESELAAACEPGWRGRHAHDTPGSGLGLAQCVALVELEGGDLTLGVTNPSAAPQHRGLTVCVRLPGRCAGVSRSVPNFADVSRSGR
jgi:signal transduction histidine kinase